MTGSVLGVYNSLLETVSDRMKEQISKMFWPPHPVSAYTILTENKGVEPTEGAFCVCIILC